MNRTVLLALLFLILTSKVFAEPWFTGPIFAEEGQTIPRGHVDAYSLTSFMTSDRVFNRFWDLESAPNFSTTLMSPQYMYGLTDFMDLQLAGFYFINENAGVSYERVGDTSVMLGFQALRQKQWTPNLRITLQEIIPTGLYTNLPVGYNGTNITGTGSYQTAVGLNFQYLSSITPDHALMSYFNVTYFYPHPVDIKGANAYGGNAETNGRIAPGNAIIVNFAEEIELTQHWALAMEAIFLYQTASRFHGNLGNPSDNGFIAPGQRFNVSRISALTHRLFPSRYDLDGDGIGNGNVDQITLAPAIEYNFSKNIGVAAGMWFTIAGKNTPDFISPILLINTYW